MNADAIVSELVHTETRVKTSFIVTSTDYLARAGRISSKISTICNTLMLHPVIILKNSSMKVGSIKFGTKDTAWKKYIVSALRGIGNIDKRTLFLVYAGLTNEELREIEEQVRKIVHFENIIFQKASPAISANCGPGTFGLIYMIK